jgi:glycosyltransferase involved in cell wall biosynthesis
MKTTFYLAATKGEKKDTLLFKEYVNRKDFFFKENNTQPLPVVYNKAIDFAIEENADYLVLCHDDIIIESDLTYKLPTLFEQFDVIGVAGTTECKLEEPALWHLMGGGFGGGKLHGAVAHGNVNQKSMTAFGFYPHRVILIDGVFMAISRKVFEKVRFDETNPAGFHFYDLDYSLSCHKEKFKIGVGDIPITHASPGLREFTPEFLEGQKWFLEKWKDKL